MVLRVTTLSKDYWFWAGLMNNVKVLSKFLVIVIMRHSMLVYLVLIDILPVLVQSVIVTDVVLMVMLMVTREKHSVLVMVN
jgi:hypothetical protein